MPLKSFFLINNEKKNEKIYNYFQNPFRIETMVFKIFICKNKIYNIYIIEFIL